MGNAWSVYRARVMHVICDINHVICKDLRMAYVQIPGGLDYMHMSRMSVYLMHGRGLHLSEMGTQHV